VVRDDRLHGVARHEHDAIARAHALRRQSRDPRRNEPRELLVAEAPLSVGERERSRAARRRRFDAIGKSARAPETLRAVLLRPVGLAQ
jgi:hypothetical protein